MCNIYNEFAVIYKNSIYLILFTLYLVQAYYLIYHNNMSDLLCYLNNSSNYHLNIYQMKCISHYYYIYLI